MTDDGQTIDRKVQGGVAFGSVNISAFDRAQGYVVHLCTMDTSQSITDLKLTRKHIQEIYDLILAWFPDVQSSTIPRDFEKLTAGPQDADYNWPVHSDYDIYIRRKS